MRNNVRKVTIVTDSMAKYVTEIREAKVVAFPGINISRLNNKILRGLVDLRSEYVILHVGTNDINTLTVSEMCSSYQDLITTVREKFGCKVVVSSILPRPIDYDVNGDKVKSLNNTLEGLCKERRIQYVRSYKPFLEFGEPRRDLFAVRDGGLHLNSEGLRRLRHVFISAVANLK